MMRTSRALLLKHHTFTVGGLRNSTIKESPVAVRIEGKEVGAFSAIELYESSILVADDRLKPVTFPQTVADITGAPYFRLTHLQRGGGSASFGSSFVGSISFREGSGRFSFIPQVQTIEVQPTADHCIEITTHGSFSDRALICSRRTYERSSADRTSMRLDIEFRVLKPITLQPLPGDSFRLLTLSSMFSSADRYDARLIRWMNRDESGQFDLVDLLGRDRHVFAMPIPASEISLIKPCGSIAPYGRPGSPDSPSLHTRIISASVPTEEIGIQAFLSESASVKEDSLTAWFEWLKAPPRLLPGLEVKVSAECSGFLDASNCRFND